MTKRYQGYINTLEVHMDDNPSTKTFVGNLIITGNLIVNETIISSDFIKQAPKGELNLNSSNMLMSQVYSTTVSNASQLYSVNNSSSKKAEQKESKKDGKDEETPLLMIEK